MKPVRQPIGDLSIQLMSDPGHQEFKLDKRTDERILRKGSSLVHVGVIEYGQKGGQGNEVASQVIRSVGAPVTAMVGGAKISIAVSGSEDGQSKRQSPCLISKPENKKGE